VRHVLVSLFVALEERGVRWCVVGRTYGLPDRVEGDVDIVVECKDPLELAPLLDCIAHKHGGYLVQALQHEATACYYVMSGTTGCGHRWFINPDICSDYVRYGRTLLEAHEILDGRQLVRIDCDRNARLWVAEPSREFIYYLIKKIEKLELGAEEGAHLSRMWRADPRRASELIREIWKDAHAELLELCASSGEWSISLKCLEELRQQLRKVKPKTFRSSAREILRVFRRLLSPTGVFVAVLGPDGSGKSTIIRQVTQRARPAFRRIAIFHFRPNVFTRPRVVVDKVADPQRLPPYCWPVSIAKILYYVADAIAGHLIFTRPAVTRSTLMVADRYYHDLLVDPRRYRYGGPKWLANVASALVPAPSLWFVMDAPVEVIQARKCEVPSSETRRQIDAYRTMANQLKRARLIRTDQSIESAAAEMVEAILGYMAARTRKRLRLRR
jgi:thymidylate kinase